MKAFNCDDFTVALQHSDLELLCRKPNHSTTLASGTTERPVYVLCHRGEVVHHLYDNDLIPTSSVTKMLMTAYKEMFYHTIAQGNVWASRTLERALSGMYHFVAGDSLYEKCQASYWSIRDRSVVDAIPMTALQRYRGKYIASFHGNIKFDPKYRITTIELVVTLYPGNNLEVRKVHPTVAFPMQVMPGNYIPSYRELFAMFMPAIDAYIEHMQKTPTL